MDFKKYQENTYVAIQPHTDKKDEVLNWAVGLSEEVGEVIGLIKHKYWGKEEPDRVEIAKEMGDVLWYLSALATTLNINLDTVAELNEKKLQYRYSTGQFSVQQSTNRHESERKFNQTQCYQQIISNIDLHKEDV